MAAKKNGMRAISSAAFVSALFISAPAPASAQELSLLGGLSAISHQSSYSWGFTYLQALSEHNALSYSWINEGHFVNNHRDGFALQYWRRMWFFDKRLALAAGIGGFVYFDTTASDQGQQYSDDHGIALIYSVSAPYYTKSNWFYQLRVNRTYTRNSINTTTAMLGIGYPLDKMSSTHTSFDNTQPDATSGDQLTAFIGRTEVNSFTSPGAWARSVEYRHGFGPYIDGTVSWINEGKTVLIRRDGIATQLWLGHSFYGNTLRLAVGAGPYFAVDSYEDDSDSGSERGANVSLLITMSASYQLSRHWLARASWNRVLTGYNKDSDIYLAGVGYRF